MLEKEKHLWDYLQVIRKRGWTMIVAFFVVVISVTIFSFRQTPVYQATARILIEKETPHVLSFKEVLDLETSDQEYYQTQYNILKSRKLAKQVIEELGMGEHASPEDSQTQSFSLHQFLQGIFTQLGLSASPSSEAHKALVKEEQIIRSLLSKITINPIRKSRLVDVSAKSTDPGQAAQITNTLVDTYIKQNFEIKLSASKDAVRWLTKELGSTKTKVADSEAALQEYKEQHAIISLEDRQNIVMQKLLQLNEAVNKARIRRAESEAEYKQIQQATKAHLESTSQVVNNPLLQQLKIELSKLESQLSELERKFRSKHPNVLALDSQITSVQKRIDEETIRIISSIKSSIKDKYKIALAQEQKLTKMLEEQKREALELNQKSGMYKILEREVEGNQRIYNALLQRVKETGLTERLESSNIRVVDRATVPIFPIAPRKTRNIFLAMMLGLLMGATLAFFFEYLDDSVKTPKEIKQELGIPFLGLIPKVSLKNGSLRKAKYAVETIVATDPRARSSEAYRRLRTNVMSSLLSDHELSFGQGSIILITSAEPREGKSCTAANLGIALAQSGKKTLIIDCDFRNPVMHQIFNINNDPGFTNMIANKTNGTKSVIQRTNIRNLDVIPCGRIPSNPSELLESPLTRLIIETLAEQYEKILLDSPPVNSVTDPVILSRIVDGVLVVVRAGETKREVVQLARDQLRDAETLILGGVLNNVDIEKNGNYYAHHSISKISPNPSLKKDRVERDDSSIFLRGDRG